MFDQDTSVISWRNGAIRNAQKADENADIANRNEAAFRAERDKCKRWQVHSAKLEARIAELEDALLIKTAVHTGCLAQLKAFGAQHPDSPLMIDSGKRYKDGDIKRRVTLICEDAFDAALIKVGIKNPSSRRVD